MSVNLESSATSSSDITYSGVGIATYIIIVFIIILGGHYIYLQYKNHISRNKIEGFNNKDATNKSALEKFTSSNFSRDSLLFPKIEPEISLKINNQIPPLLIGTAGKGTYPPVLGYYISKNIYPALVYYAKGSMASILGLLTRQIDVAIVDEDILMSCFDPDKYILDGIKSLGLSSDLLTDINKLKYISNLYYQPMILASREGTGISKVEHLKANYTNKKAIMPSIGVVDANSNSYYHLLKLLKLGNIIINKDVSVKIYKSQDDMLAEIDTLDCIYMTTNQKNKGLLDITDQMPLQFINPIPNTYSFVDTLEEQYSQAMPIITFKERNVIKWDGLSGTKIGILPKNFKQLKLLLDNTNITKYKFQSYKTLDALALALINNEVQSIYLINKTDRTNFINGMTDLALEDIFYLAPTINTNQLKDLYTDKEHNQTVMNDMIKRQFPHSYKHTINLNAFYRNSNMYSFVETRSIRMALITHQDISADKIEYLTRNLIREIPNLQKDINEFLYDKRIDNVDDTAFKQNEMASGPEEIEIHEGARTVYKEIGLLKTIETTSCDYE